MEDEDEEQEVREIISAMMKRVESESGSGVCDGGLQVAAACLVAPRYKQKRVVVQHKRPLEMCIGQLFRSQQSPSSWKKVAEAYSGG